MHRLVNEFRIKVSVSKKRRQKTLSSFQKKHGMTMERDQRHLHENLLRVSSHKTGVLVICTLIHKVTLFETTGINICARTPGRKQCCYGTVL